MTLSTSSWHSKLYLYLYGGTLPKNLCPYFWSVFAGLILFIPLTIVYLPVFLFRSYKSFDGLINQKFGEVLIWAFVLNCVACAVLWFFIKTTFIKIFAFLCLYFIIWFVLYWIGYGAYYVAQKLIPSKPRRNNHKPYKPSRIAKAFDVFIEFFISRYEKNCPSIYWFNQGTEPSTERRNEVKSRL